MSNRRSRKRKIEQAVFDSDNHFAFIAGCTEGGFPYGVTWEEQEEAETQAATHASQPPQIQLCPVSLNDIAQEMQIVSDTITTYFRRSTSEFVAVNDEYVRFLDTEEPFDDRPEWEQEAIQLTAEVMDQKNEDDFVPLPSRYEIHEYSIMESFCHTVKDQKIALYLLRSISGKGAFRRFKDAIHRYSMEEKWYKFKDESYKEIAREWCKANCISWCE